MRLVPLMVFAALSFVPSAAAEGTPPNYVIQIKLVPKSLYGDIPTQLLVTTKGGPLGGLKLSLRATNGFRVEPPQIVWPAGETHTAFVASADVRPSGTAAAPPATGSVVASLSSSDASGEKTILTEIVDFDYQPALSLWAYLLLGAIGVGVGYLLRMAIKALSDTQPQTSLALAATPPPPPIRKFVLEHYYFVDFAVTLILGLLVLMSLMKDGRPPSNAAYWYSATVIGVGLGLLTNSDLLTRVK